MFQTLYLRFLIYYSIKGVMIKEKEICLAELELKNYDFILQLDNLRSNEEMSGQYIIDLEKGSRYLQTIIQKIQLKKDHEYIFTDKKGVCLKAYKQKNMTFELSLYKKELQLLQFVDNFKIDLQDCFASYISQLKTFWSEYQKIRKEKQNKVRCENWRKIKKQLQNHTSKHILKNTIGNLSLQCTIQVKNQYDKLIYQQPSSQQWNKKEKQLSTNFSDKSLRSRNSLSDKKRNTVSMIQKTLLGQKLQKSQSLVKFNNKDENSKIQEYIKLNDSQLLPISSQLGSKLKVKTALSHIVEAKNQAQVEYYGDQKPSHFIVETSTKSNNFKRNQSLSYISKKDEEELSTVIQQKAIQIQKEQNGLNKNQSPIPFRMKYCLLFLIVYAILCMIIQQKLRAKRQLIRKGNRIHKQQIIW